MTLTERLCGELEHELTSDILPWWSQRMLDPGGGFYGRISHDGTLHRDAPRGAVMHARILWTFSAAYRILDNPGHLDVATHAKRYLIDRFYDREHGGVYWSLTPEGQPLDTKKQFYALGFAIYGLSEYARATGDQEALDYAVRLFHDIEAHSFDPVGGGYIEAAARDWSEIADLRLSEKDANERKTMNTHLHILEPYTNLLRVWPDDRLKERLRGLITIFTTRIMQPSGHLGLFFDDDWNLKSPDVSYGHDIEASWLLLEAAMEIGDERLAAEVKEHSLRIAAASMEGMNPDGSMSYELRGDGTRDDERHWWVQAEAVVGQFYLWKFHGVESALDGACRTWTYISDKLVDPFGGEWWWSILGDGTVNRTEDKAGFWKCPYHNGRMCLELLDQSRPASD